MRNLITWIRDNPIRSMFLVPIFLVAGISISHVVAWYDITNPFSWAIYLSVAIEIGAITALIAATQKIKGGVWFMFGLVTFVQMIGNIFYSYKEIDPNGELFKSWVELTSPIFEIFGTEPTDVISHKRWLAILGGGLLPIISLTSLHFFVRYQKPEEPKIENDKDLEITSLFDLESQFEEEKPKPKRGRKKKETEPIQEEPKVEETQEVEEVIVEEVEEVIVEEVESITETTTLPIVQFTPKPQYIEKPKPRKLTYTKIQ